MLEMSSANQPPLRILFVTPYVPSRLRPRPYHLIRELLTLGHRVLLYAIGDEQDDQPAIEEVRSSGVDIRVFPVSLVRSLRNCARAVAEDLPFQAAVSASPELNQAVGRACREDFDILHLEHLRSAMAAPTPSPIPTVFDSVDCITRLWKAARTHRPHGRGAALARIDLERTRRFEAGLTSRFARVLVSSSADRNALTELGATADASIRVLPNGVDIDYFHPSTRDRDPATLVFVGRMSYHANIAAAHRLLTEIAPRIWRRHPETRIRVVGQGPPRWLRALARSLGPRVTLTGYVPDVRESLNEATMAVVPLVYAVGIQNKILEAMSTATPVVCSASPLDSIAAEPGRHLLSGSSSDEIADCVLELLSNPTQRAEIGNAGREYVATHHRWRDSAKTLEATYRELIGSARVGAA